MSQGTVDAINSNKIGHFYDSVKTVHIDAGTISCDEGVNTAPICAHRFLFYAFSVFTWGHTLSPRYTTGRVF